MPTITKIPRYNKLQKVLINEEEITLIEHLKALRINQKITKKKISNIIKQNDSWYSQIERNGKNGDDNRQKTIYRPDLINIISIIKFGANSIADLGVFQSQSEIYIDKILKITPLSESIESIEWYQINNHRTPDMQESLFISLTDSIYKSLQQAFMNLSLYERDFFLDSLKEINASLKIDTCFLISLAGLPFSEFLYEADQNRIDKLITDIMQLTDKFQTNNKSDIFSNKQYYEEIKEALQEYISISKYTRRNNFQIIDDDN